MRIYTPEPLKELPIHQTFYFLYPPKDMGGGLFRDVNQTFFKEVHVEDIESSDAIVLANNFAKELDGTAREYIARYADMAERTQKPIYLFSCGDFTDVLKFDPRVYVFRYSLYRPEVGPRDIAIPTITEDPPQELIFIQKKRAKPLVSFCGQGGFNTPRRWAAYYVKTLVNIFASVLNPRVRARRLGVYWRRKMIAACKKSSLVATNFIVRGSFSGNKNSIELDPAQARREYLESSANADFVLAPKGDGNYSNRFLKTLAFGRIPVLVDTDVVLPLEHMIDYSKIVVRVPMNRVRDTPKFVDDFYSALDEEQWKARQRLAREIFEKYLRQDAFFEQYFSQAPVV